MAHGLFVKLDPRFIFHRKAVQVGPFGRLLYISALGYCVETLSDGFIPSRVTSRVSDVDDPDPQASVTALVQAGLWLEVEGGYQIHGYLEWQTAAAEVEKHRENNRNRQERYRNKTATRVSNALHNGPVTRPDKRREDKRISNTPLTPQGGKKPETEPAPFPESLDTPECRKVVAEWVEHRRQRREPATPLAVEKLLKQWSRAGPAEFVAAVEHSIANGWLGVHPPKPNKESSYGNSTVRSPARIAAPAGKYDDLEIHQG